MFNSIASLLRGIIAGVFLARYLGVSLYGEYAFITSLTALLVTISHFGIDNIAIKDFAVLERNADKYIQACILIIQFCSFAVLLAFCIIVQIKNLISIPQLLMIVALIIVQFLDVFRYELIAKYATKEISISRSVIYFASVITIAVGINLKLSLFFFLITYIVTEMMLIAQAYVVCHIKGYRYNFKNLFSYPDYSLVKRLLRISFPLWIGSISVSIYMKIDQIMIREMLNSSELGFYSVAVKISELWYFIPTVICTSMLPYFSDLHRKNIEEFWEKYEKFNYFIIAIGIAFAIGLTVAGDVIVNLLYGKEYAFSAQIIKMYSWAGIFVSMGVSRSIFLTINELTSYSCAFSIIAAILNCCLNYILIPRIGIMGATIATFVSYFLQSYALDFFIIEIRKVAIVQTKSLISPIMIFKRMYNKKM